MARRFGLGSGVFICLALLGCKVGPDYKRPEMPVPEGFRGSPAAEASIANVPWWDLFKDEQLRQLITTALAENRDMKIAIERIEEARATFGISKADLYPHLNARLLGGGLNPSDGSLTHTPEGGGTGATGLFDASLSVSWELDFFGRIRRGSEAQKASLLATDEARHAVAIALVSDVATAYVDLRGLDRRLAITKDTLAARQERVELTRIRFEGHVSNEVDWRQAEAEYFRIQAMAIDLEKLVAQKENEISFLIGRNPGEILRNRSPEEQPTPPTVPAGLPAALLEHRPDMRKAEMELWSATARIGEAKAALYPSIKLTGSYGLASTDLSQLVDPASQSWNLFAGLLQPIFAGGALRGKVEVRESQQRQAVYAYERTLLQALREVEDALIALSKIGEERVAQHDRVFAARRVLELSDLRYKGGVSTYLDILDAQRSLFNAEISEATSVSEQAATLIQLYKALGGGWTVTPLGEVPPPPDKSDKSASVAPKAAKAPSAAPTATPAPTAAPAPSAAPAAASTSAPAPAPAPAAGPAVAPTPAK
jgi:multidrug efflux system outer membrane protein